MTDYSSVISAEELAEMLGTEALCLVDCRFDLLQPEAGREQWRTSRIPGAQYAHLDEDLAGPVSPETGRHPLPSPASIVNCFRRLGVNRDSQVVVYDDSAGAIAARAWWLFRWLGHDRVAVLDGGFSNWREGGGAIDEKPPTSGVPGNFDGEPRSDWIVTTEDVLEQGALPLRLRDARDAARFRGEIEPIDPVAGHVPGSRNLPFSELLAPGGRMLPPSEVRKRISDSLDNDLERPWTVMCGSGVTACHLALGAQYAGLQAPRLYVGSFSEWIRDSGRPVGKGTASSAGCAERP